ncbi:MAG: hypothetical protein HOW73_05050 [Polyangiaceae bacterium]|nr:hypothetical protein [Polyangiaceae bacterium]
MTISSLRTLGAVFALALAACGSESDDNDGGGGSGASTADGGGGSGQGGGGADSTGGSGGGGASSGGGENTGGGGGSDGPDVDVSDPQLYEFELDPHELDPSTEDSLETQLAMLDTRTTPVGRLVIFLPGANNVPNDWRDHGRVLAKFGFHVVLPHYNNRWSSNGTCDGMGNSCATDTRWEALVGEDTSSAIEIPRADSAEGRVVTMLEHLKTEHPGGDWGYYLTADGELRYEDIVIAGISHGAASTGLYAARRPFSRAVMHASGPAGDSSAPKETPLSEWYAFVHTEDPAFDAITSSWEGFEIIGDLTNVDGASAPYANSHRLTTSAPSEYPHGSVAGHNSFSPMDDNGNFVFEPAWRYLYGVSQ